MTELSTSTVIEEIIDRLLGYEPDEYDLDATLGDDLDADSLSLVEMALEIETVFGIKVAWSKAPMTVGELIEFVDRNRRSAAA